MSEVNSLVDQIKFLAETHNRVIVAIAGAPGSGKSTLVAELNKRLSDSVVVPMDGFHLDNIILEERKLMPRKGSPASFDADGYIYLLKRIRGAEETAYAPVFDRRLDLSKAAAIEILKETRIILTEGNYLLLDQAPWNNLAELFDLSVFLEVPEAVLRERLIRRWLDHGLSEEKALARAESNDLPNAELVTQSSISANVVIKDF